MIELKYLLIKCLLVCWKSSRFFDASDFDVFRTYKNVISASDEVCCHHISCFSVKIFQQDFSSFQAA